MTETTYRLVSEAPAPASAVFDWHLKPGAFGRLVPPWQEVEVVSGGGVSAGSRVLLRVRKGPLKLAWELVHDEVTPGAGFVDRQLRGPFGSWRHVHRFTDAASGTSTLEDEITYSLPFGMSQGGAVGRSIAADVDAAFRYRHRVTVSSLRDVAVTPHGSEGRLTVAVTGASGLIGSALSPYLSVGGDDVVRVVRGGKAEPGVAVWDVEGGRLTFGRGAAPPGAVVHLAGENIGSGVWTAAKKERIRASRVYGTASVVRAVLALPERPSVFVSASAVGFYGPGPDPVPVTEESPRGEGFLADVTAAWEEALMPLEDAGVRVVRLRFGVVLDPRGGALSTLLPLYKTCVGARLGDGSAPLSWVTAEDAVRAVRFAIKTPEMSGPVNVCSPETSSGAALHDRLAAILGRPNPLAVPAAIVKAVGGSLADEVLLAGRRVVPAALVGHGFRFEFPGLDDALRTVLGRPSV